MLLQLISFNVTIPFTYYHDVAITARAMDTVSQMNNLMLVDVDHLLSFHF